MNCASSPEMTRARSSIRNSTESIRSTTERSRACASAAKRSRSIVPFISNIQLGWRQKSHSKPLVSFRFLNFARSAISKSGELRNHDTSGVLSRQPKSSNSQGAKKFPRLLLRAVVRGQNEPSHDPREAAERGPMSLLRLRLFTRTWLGRAQPVSASTSCCALAGSTSGTVPACKRRRDRIVHAFEPDELDAPCARLPGCRRNPSGSARAASRA